MDMNTGKIHELSQAEAKRLAGEISEGDAKRKLMQMSEAQVEAVKDMPNRKARRHMLAQPCDCGSGRQARKCCFNKQA